MIDVTQPISEFKGVLGRIEDEEKALKSVPREMKSFSSSKKFEKTAAANKAMFEQVCLLLIESLKHLYLTLEYLFLISINWCLCYNL